LQVSRSTIYQGTKENCFAIKKSSKPRFVLVVGGVERLYNAGIEKLGVIHRGFLNHEKTNNIPE
jgi:chorismate mutase